MKAAVAPATLLNEVWVPLRLPSLSLASNMNSKSATGLPLVTPTMPTLACSCEGMFHSTPWTATCRGYEAASDFTSGKETSRSTCQRQSWVRLSTRGRVPAP